MRPLKLFALAALVIAAMPLMADEGGITFPIVADFKDVTGTLYATEMYLYSNSPSTPIYLRYEWLPLDGQNGTAIDYSSTLNPMIDGPVIMRNVGNYLRNTTSKEPGNIGTVRISPVDKDGRPLPGVRLTGFSRTQVLTPDGGRLSERTQGVTDDLRPGARALRVQPWIVYGPHRNEVRHFWLTNFDSVPRKFGFSSSTTGWSWGDSVVVPAKSQVAVAIPQVPDEILNSTDILGHPFDTIFNFVAFNAGCNECTQPYVVALTSINSKSNDVRALLDAFSDR